jgi:protein gp37
MGETTAIGWTDSTFNPWWGCARVSPGCEHCYAEAFAKRTGRAQWGKNAERVMASENVWAQPVKWEAKAAAAGVVHRVFCASMSDVFEDRPELVEPRARLLRLIEETPHLIWQLLTKRPENVNDLTMTWWGRWPANAWIGTTVEDQQRAFERIPQLVRIPAAVRFLSCEPLLERVEIAPWLYPQDTFGVDWVICGGESGPGHRPLPLDGARSIRDQCARAGVPFFFKQVGGHHPTTGGDLLDGVHHKAFPSGIGRD